MVGIHVGQLPKLALVGIMSNGAKRTVRFTFSFSYGSLFCENLFLGCLIKNPDIEQFCVDHTPKDILKNTFTVFYIRITVKLLQLLLILWPDHTLYCDIFRTIAPTPNRTSHSPHL